MWESPEVRCGKPIEDHKCPRGCARPHGHDGECKCKLLLIAETDAERDSAE